MYHSSVATADLNGRQRRLFPGVAFEATDPSAGGDQR
jgi:hypothetical protein